MVIDYILNIVFATRKPDEFNLQDLKGLIEYGGSPRATINLTLAAKARAFLEHRGYVTPEDVRYVGMDVLRHRVILSYEAEAEEMSPEDIIQRIYDTIEINQGYNNSNFYENRGFIKKGDNWFRDLYYGLSDSTTHYKILR